MLQSVILLDISRCVPFEDHGARGRGRGGIGLLAEPGEVLIPNLIGEPGRLEWAVALQRARHVVVNALARTGEEARRGVTLIHNQVGVRFIALQRDSHNHLTHGSSSQRIRAAEGLRAEQHVDAKRAALAHNSVEQDRSDLRYPIFFGEELLKFINDQHDPRQRQAGICAPVARQVLSIGFAKEVSTPAKLLVHALEDAQAELAIAFNGDNPGVGQAMIGVALELDAFLKIDEVKLHLVGAAPQSRVRDDDVEKG